MEGLQAGILALLERNFKAASSKYARKVRATRDVERLQALLEALKRAKNADDVQRALHQQPRRTIK